MNIDNVNFVPCPRCKSKDVHIVAEGEVFKHYDCCDCDYKFDLEGNEVIE